MSTTTLRTPASFRFDTSLLNLLKEKAKENHKSLNNYVESILMDFLQVPQIGNKHEVTPSLQDRISRARENYQKGNYVSCKNKEELHALLNSL